MKKKPATDESEFQQSRYRSFIRESIKDLKKNGSVIVFRKYQIDDIKKCLSNYDIKIYKLYNYYQLVIERK